MPYKIVKVDGGEKVQNTETGKFAVHPPPHLMYRISRNTDPVTYEQVGKQGADAFMCALDAWRSGARDVLDWGCGPGRVAGYLLDAYPAVRLSGCDIDSEAIAWASENLPGGTFTVIGPYPPLPYGDSSFDAVLALSVMTHLHRRNQRIWLRELARVLCPSGILVATVHGQAAARGFGKDGVTGIDDRYLDECLNGIAPERYYRAVLQSRSYTRLAWADWFEIMDYREACIGTQDLVICRVRNQER